MARIIVYDGREHPDPDPARTIEEVQEMMSHWYPDMANATFKTEKQGTDTHYVFRKAVGTKGTTAHEDLAALILRTPAANLEILQLYERLALPDGTLQPADIRDLYREEDSEQELQRILTDTNRYTSSVAHLFQNMGRLAN